MNSIETQKLSRTKKKRIVLIILLLVAVFSCYLWSGEITEDLLGIYETRESATLEDRNGEIIEIKINQNGFYSAYGSSVSEEFENLLLKKEDRYFYYHPGFNPVSTISAAWDKFRGNKVRASSTITQQLVKILLKHEKERTVRNKIQEIIYAVGLEVHSSKEEILKMYLNSIFLGNNVQGIELASRLYFESSPEMMSESDILRLLATISSPSTTNPFLEANLKVAEKIAKKLELTDISLPKFSSKKNQLGRKKFQSYIHNMNAFEINSLKIDCDRDCQTTIDSKLSETIREIAAKNLIILQDKNVQHAAVVVLKFPENEILAMVGSPDPTSSVSGNQINMATKPRPIGSTVKPFIYTKAFEKKLRAYTLVEDKEYKYVTADDFAFYPKNYDEKHYGVVNLHYALSNSLNIPTVKVLEFIGLEDFYKFLEKDLEFAPVQNLDKYQLGIALGQLEMSLLQLSYYFSIFAQEGRLPPLSIGANFPIDSAVNSIDKIIFPPEFVQMTNQILTDRNTSIDQFSLLSNLNTGSKNVALKTGTSREYHDSWVIGYTPDFLVGVWMGNAENTPMKKVSGQVGAGKIWHEVINLMLNSKYNHQSIFPVNLIREFPDGENLEYGLPDDDFEQLKNILIKKENSLIVSPHDGDVFLLDDDVKIFLKARENVKWFHDGELLEEGEKFIFVPKESGTFTFQAIAKNGEKAELTLVVEENF